MFSFLNYSAIARVPVNIPFPLWHTAAYFRTVLDRDSSNRFGAKRKLTKTLLWLLYIGMHEW